MALPVPLKAMFYTLAIVPALVWYFMTPAERHRVGRVVTRQAARLKGTAVLLRGHRDETLELVLRERTPRPIVTALLVGANLALFTWTQLDAGVSITDMFGNVAPQTTNGEWWRLMTANMVHESAFLLLLNLAALAQVGRVLERLVGSPAFAVVYFAAGVFANLAGLSAAPVTLVIGAAGAIFGLYGLLVASWMWGACQHAESTIRLRTIKALAPLAFVFSMVNLAAGSAAAQCTALAIGFLFGVFLTRSVRVSVPSVRRVATVAAASAYVAIVASVPLRGISDVRPTLARAKAVEEQTAAKYESSMKQFQLGRIDRRELAQVIDRQILPQLQIVRFELQALDRAPREHLALVQNAEIYALRRIESWKIRSRALHDADWRQLRTADAVERVALDKLPTAQ